MRPCLRLLERRLGKREIITVRIEDAELAHPIIHHLRSPHEWHLPLPLGRQRYDAFRIEVKRAAATGRVARGVRRVDVELDRHVVAADLGPLRLALDWVDPGLREADLLDV